MTKITKAFASLIGFARGTNKPSAAAGNAAGTRPATNATLQDLASRKASALSGAALTRAGTARPRLAARELPRLGAAARARAEAAATAREVARIQALPSPALPLDLDRRFAALKAITPKPTGQPGVTLNRPAVESAKPESAKPESAKPESAKPESAKPESAKPESAKPESAKPESTKPESTKPESTKPEGTKPEGAKPESAKPESTKLEGAAELQGAREELANLAGKVHEHVNAMHAATTAHPTQQQQLLQQEIAALHELAIVISQILQRLTRRAGEALLSITRS